MKCFGVILLVMALLASTLTCTAQDPIPFNELARESSSSFSFVDARADYDGQAASSKPAYPRRHWTKAGKIMTFVGVPLLVLGGASMVSTVRDNSCVNHGTCLGKPLVVVLEFFPTAAGAALTVVGATRRSW